MDSSFAGKVAMVTGAAHGFGRAICEQLAQRGAHVWACDLREDELEETERICRERGGVCAARPVDVTVEGAVADFVGEVLAASGGVHILVNNAGGVVGQVGKPIETVSADDYGVLFFASDYAAWCTGQVLSIDGGKVMF